MLREAIQSISRQNMKHPNEKRFQDFFAHGSYITLKNHLYNYLVRKSAIERGVLKDSPNLILEVGSGLSPVISGIDRVVYSDLSFDGLIHLRKLNLKGWFVVADCTALPFKSGTFTHTICSEVLEHVEHDQQGIDELARVLDKQGRLHVTFPHRKIYFWNDDRFAGHFRRYELAEMTDKLYSAGLRPVEIQKVLGPLEKISMSLCIFILTVFQVFGKKRVGYSSSHVPKALIFFFKWANRAWANVARLEARIMPQAFSAVLMIRADKF
jgi:ubiquinone/menaquinone biosynthesis C-methylase UbiE